MSEERRANNNPPLFSKSITLGNILTIISLGAAGVAVYTQIYADVRDSKIEIANIKSNEVKREMQDSNTRQEIRQDVRDVKQDVKALNDKVDKIIYELGRQSRERERR